MMHENLITFCCASDCERKIVCNWRQEIRIEFGVFGNGEVRKFVNYTSKLIKIYKHI